MTLPLTELLVAQRARGVQIDSLPPELVPADAATAYRVQTETVLTLGPVGAWKVQPYPETGEPFAAPIPRSTVFGGKAELAASTFPAPAIEAEVAVTLNRDLPQRAESYSAEELAEAIGSLHLAIEVLSSRFAAPSALPFLVSLADLQNNAAVIVGPARSAAALPKLGEQPMIMAVDGTEIGRVAGGATTRTVLRSLAWLADHAAARGLPLKQGDVIITGARIGALPLEGRTVVVEAEGFEPVSATFE
ncbi:2-keto-4-pentenoate hydratase [Devosia albogilva]|uniref:2-keto-4-pentenoate hydratase n=1 Tax=Devosia albogilva TaxID=429726 RepID=A0ABW5QMV0_9HYPH